MSKKDLASKISSLRVEEGPSIKDFEPDCSIDRWWTQKERHLKCPRLNSADYVNLSTLTMSDLENSDEEECFSL